MPLDSFDNQDQGARLARRRLFLIAGSAFITLQACKRSEPASCIHVMGLNAADTELRKTLQYVDRTPIPSEPCNHCVQWIAPDDSSKCGGCKIMKGPVHPRGYCKLFAASRVSVPPG